MKPINKITNDTSISIAQSQQTTQNIKQLRSKYDFFKNHPTATKIIEFTTNGIGNFFQHKFNVGRHQTDSSADIAANSSSPKNSDSVTFIKNNM